MNIITIMEANIKKEHQKNWNSFLSLEKYLVESHFDWIELLLNKKDKSLIGKGHLLVNNTKVEILLSYSPFHSYRYDRIYINDSSIEYNDEIHLYRDLSLCLYHPVIDKQYLKTIPLFRMIPWISEWIIFYQQ